MAGGDEMVEILKEIRDELRFVRGEVHALRTDTERVWAEIHGLRTETMERFGMIEGTLLDLAESARFKHPPK
jgi:hypothetical protein